MSDELIDNYIDREGVRRDTAYMLESLNAVYDGFKKVESVKLDLKSLSGLSTIAPGMQQARDAATVLAEATATVQQRIIQLNGHSKEFTTVLLAQVKAEKEAAQAHLLEAKAANETAKAKQATTKASQDVVRQAVTEKKAAQDAANEYRQLSLAYNEATLRAKNMQLVMGANHPLAVQAAKDAAALGTLLKAADSSVGQYQRNVGDYGNAITKAASGAFGAIRQIAYILPGLGIAGIFSAIFDGISAAANALFSFSSNTEKAREEFKKFLTTASDIQANASAGTEGELARVQVLAKVVEDQTQSYKRRNEALNQLKDINKNYFGDLDLEKLKVGQLTSIVNDYSDAVIASAIVKAFSEEIGKLAVELSKQERAYNAAGHAVDFYKKAVVDARSKAGDPQGMAAINFDVTTAENNLLGATNKFKAQGAAVDLLRKQMFDLRAAIKDAISEQIKFKDLTGETGKNDAKKAEDIAERRRKAIYEAAKAELETTAETNKAIYTDESQTHAKRIEALRAYTEAKNGIINLEADFEKGKKGVLAEEVVKIDAEKNKKITAQGVETAKELEKINKAIYGYVEKSAAAQTEVYTKLYKDLGAFAAKFEESLKDAEKKRIEQKKKNAQEELQNYKQLYTELTSLAVNFVTAADDRQREAIQRQIDALDTQKQKDIEVANQTIANAQDKAAAIAVIEARASAQKEQLQKKQDEIEKKKQNTERVGKALNIGGDLASGIMNISIKAAEARAQAALYATNPLTAALAPLALAQAGFITSQIPILVAISAAQLASLAIPRYKDGKNVSDRYEGYAVVGDGGKHEAIIREDGSIQITDNKPQLTYVKSNDIVVPDARKLAAHQTAVASASISGQIPVYVSDNTAIEVRRMADKVVGAIKRIPQPHIKVENLLQRRIKRGDSSNTYLNSNLQG